MRRVHSGEVYQARLDPVEGSEQAKTRPVIVLQNPDLARFTSTALCIPLTTNMKRLGLPGTCFVPKGEAGLGADGVALAFQMRALDVSRLGRRYCCRRSERVQFSPVNRVHPAYFLGFRA